MSTTFGVKIPNFEELYCEEYIEVAFRGGKIGFTNPLAQLLPDETHVEPLDNEAQGIYTIGDIKRQILEQESKK